MPWWPKYVAHWCRFQRHLLRDNDKLIRGSGAFTKSHRSYAQRNEEDTHRTGLDAEWKRMEEDMLRNAYEILFGRSNDMLAGKAGKRMSAEENSNTPAPAKRNRSNSTSSSARPPDNINPDPQKAGISEERATKTNGSFFPEPSYSRRIEQSNYSSAIISPSDTRRPRDVPVPPVADGNTNDVSARYERNTGEQVRNLVTEDDLSHGTSDSRAFIWGQEQDHGQQAQPHSKGQSFKESGSIMIPRPGYQVTNESEEANWRETTLDRRGRGTTKSNQNRTPPTNQDQIPQNLSSSATISSNQVNEEPVETAGTILAGLQSRGYTQSEISRGMSSGEWPEPELDVSGYDRNKHSTSDFRTKILDEVGEKEPAALSSKSDSITLAHEETKGDLQSASNIKMIYEAERNNSTDSPLYGNSEISTAVKMKSEAQSDEWRTVDASKEHGSEFTRSSTDPETRYDNVSVSCPTQSLREKFHEQSTFDVLGRLPKDDLDLLTASDIRASMDAKIKAREHVQEQSKPRDQLEQDFANAHEQEQLELPTGEKVLADQHNRRTERQLLNERKQKATDVETAREESTGYSLESIAKLLQLGGDTLVKTFWSEPVATSQQKASKDLETHLIQIRSAVEQGRAAMTNVAAEISSDFPALEPLLTRVDELRDPLLINVRKKLRTLSAPDNTDHNSNRVGMRNVRLIEELLDSAEKSLKKSGRRVLKMQSKQRIRYASLIVQMNLKLTKEIIKNHQRVLQQSSVDGTSDIVFWNIGHALLSLQDAMTALQSILTQVMYKFDIDPIKPAPKDLSSTRSRMSESITASTEAPSNQESISNRTQNLAADQQLENEVEIQKAAMQGLYDAGYKHASSPTANSSLEEGKPLMNSLFRPFGLQLGKLENELEEGSSKASVQTPLDKQNLHDQTPTQEIKDVPGEPIGSDVINHHEVKANMGTQVEAEKENMDLISMEPPTAERLSPGIGNDSASSAPELVIAETQERTPLISEALEREANETAQALASINTDESSNAAQQQSLSNTLPSTVVEASAPTPSTPVTYTTLTYDPVTETMYTTRSSSASPPSDPPIPIHTALATLSHPFKFLPHLPPHFTITLATPHLLTIRESPPDAPDSVDLSCTRIPGETELRDEEWRKINPVDGTTRLSPTGFVGVDDFREDIRREMEERRKAGQQEELESQEGGKSGEKDGGAGKDRRKGGGVASVFKTAIMAGAVCYVAGVGGEILRDGERGL